MKYNLWDIEIGKLVGQFKTEEAALTALRDLAARFGGEYAEHLRIGHEGDDGESHSPPPVGAENDSEG